MLDINPVLLFASAILFLLVLVRLNSCLYRPLINYMDDRDISIKSDVENAKSNNASLEDLLLEGKSIIANAKIEASAIRQKAYDDAKIKSQAKIHDMKLVLEAQYIGFVSEIQNEKELTKQVLLDQIPFYRNQIQLKLASI